MITPREELLRRRRGLVAAHAAQIGLDFIAVEPFPDNPLVWRLILHFIPGAPDKQAVPARLREENLRFAVRGDAVDGLFTLEIPSGGIVSAPGQTTVALGVRFAGDTDRARRLGAAPVFTLELVEVPDLDPFFSRVDFSLDPEIPLAEDCRDEHPPAPGPEAPLAGDYLARDYASFRQRMLDHLAQKLPAWTERSPADLLVTLVELLADAGDQASYFQDAVATEAYLATARLRTSVRRHARLVGYRMHEGSNARVWVQVRAGAAPPAPLPAGTGLLTRVSGAPPRVDPDPATLEQLLAAGPLVFETLATVTVRPEHHEMPLYTWGAEEFALPRGATCAELLGAFPDLVAGEVLILEQVLGEATGLPADVDRSLRHAVRLTRVTPAEDPLGPSGPVELTRIEWHPGDALPAPLPLAARIGGTARTGLAVARGNLVPADHGRTVTETLTATPGRFRPRLSRRGLTFRQADSGDPRDALPALALSDAEGSWTLRRDLLGSDRFARDFVVEMEEDGTATLRFGDGTLGRPPAPGTVLTATYRVGNGTAGNLGRDSLAHVITGDAGIAGARNPLPAVGGADPEPLDSVRLAAPGSIDALESESTVDDIVLRAEAHPEVERAAASLRWTGSWYVLEVAVLRTGGMPVDAAFASALLADLEDVRIAGWEIAILPLSFVGLDLAFTILLDPDAARSRTERALLETFGNRDLPGGRRGFFHPANLGFGQPVYLSRIVAAALAVPGVRAVDTDDRPPRRNRFRRFGEPSRGELAAGEIRPRRGEVLRVDNDPEAPENGSIQFFLEGGR